jgi:AcrR family transcriptional regulator
MSPRPRTVPDNRILEVARRLMGRLGPSKFTLAAVARAVGLAPATLVQRFGSKRGLLLALAGPGGEDPAAELLTRLKARFPSPLAQLRGFLAGFAVMAPSPEELANHLAFLQIDLVDPEFHRIALDLAEANQAATAQLVSDAMRAGELRNGDSRALARMLQAVAAGGLLNWGIVREGSARDWILRDLDLALEGWRAVSRPG